MQLPAEHGRISIVGLRTDGRTVGWTEMTSYPNQNFSHSRVTNSLSHGAPLRAPAARESSAKNKVINYGTEKPVISSSLLESNMLSDFRYSNISLEAFLLTAFRTSGKNSECFVMLLAAAC